VPIADSCASKLFAESYASFHPFFGAVYMSYKNQIREFIITNFLFGEAEKLTDTTSFLDAGIIDSTGILEIVSYLEEQFSITVDDDELLPENLDSVDAIAGYLAKKSGVRSQEQE
jgi:acyl carrier protein